MTTTAAPRHVVRTTGDPEELRTARLLALAAALRPGTTVTDDTIRYGLAQRGVEPTEAAVARVRELLDSEGEGR